ncbi:hypothetical protein COCOBI_04-1670 [Coccomyxa sp. Obi]|nr:hypothetical protein COCOBI_04-1670 [Coccomyxa sp. Obi]
MKGFEGLLTGRVIVTCSNNKEILDLPGGTHVLELISRAEQLFGCGCLIDKRRCVRTSTLHGRGFTSTPDAILQNIRGGSYVWIPTPPGAGEPGEPDEPDERDVLYVCQKRPTHVHHRTSVRADVYGAYCYGELAWLVGYNEWFLPQYIVLGDPEIMRIYKPGNYGSAVLIDRSELGDWGTRGKHVPMEGRGWWSVFMDLLRVTRISSLFMVATRWLSVLMAQVDLRGIGSFFMDLLQPIRVSNPKNWIWTWTGAQL